jgi:hypothetical protein
MQRACRWQRFDRHAGQIKPGNDCDKNLLSLPGITLQARFMPKKFDNIDCQVRITVLSSIMAQQAACA